VANAVAAGELEMRGKSLRNAIGGWTGLVLGCLLAACQPSPPPVALRAVTMTPGADATGGNGAEDAAALGRFLINGLVLPLLDDAEPPRFTEVALGLMCADAKDVRVDGRRLAEGMETPAAAFVVQWQFAGTCPFGAEGPRLSGAADVLVLRDDEMGLQALARRPAAMQLARGAP
jgi:hypothetical protein